MTDSTDPIIESDQPDPPRYRWFKRSVVAVVLTIVALCVVRWQWGVSMDRRFAAAIAAAHARGEPATYEDFDDPPLPPPSENAAVVFNNAWGSVGLTKAEADFIDNLDVDKPLTAADAATVETIVAPRAAILASCRQAVDIKGDNFGNRFRPPAMNILLRRLTWLRLLSEFLRMDVAGRLYAGDGPAAVADAGAILRLGKTTEHDSPFLVSDMAADRIDSVAAEAAIDIARKWPSDPVTADKLVEPTKHLIGHLLDEADARSAIQRAFYAERLFAIDRANRAIPVGLFDDWTERALRPALVGDGLMIFRSDTEAAFAATQTDLPTSAAMISSPPRQGSLAYMIGHDWGSTMSWWHPDRVILAHCERSATCRAAATLLAIRLFERDRGRFPTVLGELVPGYLPGVPVDPLAAGGRPLSYVLRGGNADVYSVGKNGLDDGGLTLPTPPAKSSWSIWENLDAVWSIPPRH